LLSGKPQRSWLWLGMTAILAVALTAGWAFYLEQTSFDAVRNTYELIISTDQFLSTLTNAEIGALRYVLTGEPNDLQLFTDSRKVLVSQGDRFRTLVENDLVENDPSQLAQVEKLERLIQLRLAELSAAIRARNSAGLETARTMLLTEQGQRLIDDTRTVITEMKNAEQNTLGRFSLTRRSKVHTGLVALSSSAMLALCCLLIGHVLLSRNIFAREKAEGVCAKAKNAFVRFSFKRQSASLKPASMAIGFSSTTGFAKCSAFHLTNSGKKRL
jgi:CHASE3 domain sensor protein